MGEKDKRNGEPLDFCRTAPSAEQARASDADEPCDDYRAATGIGDSEGEGDAAGSPRPGKGDALVLIDIQNDFLRGGALEVPGGEEVVPVLNRYMKIFEEKGLPIIATRDWHPPDHRSFKQQGGPWPPHCVQETPGAAFAPGLHLPGSVVIVSTGAEAEKEGYSGFEEETLEHHLKRTEAKRLWVGGLATDYCVRHTVLDALRRGYEVLLLEDAVRAVDVTAGDGERAIQEMQSEGAKLVRLESLLD